MRNHSRLVRAKIGSAEAPVINAAFYTEGPARPDLHIRGQIIRDPVVSVEQVHLRFDRPDFIHAARSLYDNQRRDPSYEPGLLIFNDSGEYVRGVIQKVSDDIMAGTTSLTVSLERP
jgi:hypothetical protein